MLLKIKELRTQKKISQDVLALKTGISKRMILDYEREIKDIPLQKLQLIAIALEVSIFDLIELKDEEKKFVSTPLQNDCNEKIKELEERIGFYKEKIDFVERKLEDCEAEKKRIKTIS